MKVVKDFRGRDGLTPRMLEVLDDLDWYPDAEIWCCDVHPKVLKALLDRGLVRPKPGEIESATRFYFELTEYGKEIIAGGVTL